MTNDLLLEKPATDGIRIVERDGTISCEGLTLLQAATLHDVVLGLPPHVQSDREALIAEMHTRLHRIIDTFLSPESPNE